MSLQQTTKQFISNRQHIILTFPTPIANDNSGLLNHFKQASVQSQKSAFYNVRSLA